MLTSSILVSDEIWSMGFLIPLKEIREFGEYIYLKKCRWSNLIVLPVVVTENSSLNVSIYWNGVGNTSSAESP